MADKPTPSTLMKISAEVTTLFLCEELVKALSVQPSLVKTLSKKHGGMPCMIAFGILQHWTDENGEGATSQVLYETLKRSRRKSLQRLARDVRFLLVKKGRVISRVKVKLNRRLCVCVSVSKGYKQKLNSRQLFQLFQPYWASQAKGAE